MKSCAQVPGGRGGPLSWAVTAVRGGQSRARRPISRSVLAALWHELWQQNWRHTWAALPPGPHVAGCHLEGTALWAPGSPGVGVTVATAGRVRWGLGPLRGAVATPRSAGRLSSACLWGPGSDPGIPAEPQRPPHARRPSAGHTLAPAPLRGSCRSLLGPVVPPEAAPWAARERTPVPQAALRLRTRGADTPRSCPAAFSSCHQPAGLASAVFETPTQG